MSPHRFSNKDCAVRAKLVKSSTRDDCSLLIYVTTPVIPLYISIILEVRARYRCLYRANPTNAMRLKVPGFFLNTADISRDAQHIWRNWAYLTKFTIIPLALSFGRRYTGCKTCVPNSPFLIGFSPNSLCKINPMANRKSGDDSAIVRITQ